MNLRQLVDFALNMPLHYWALAVAGLILVRLVMWMQDNPNLRSK